MNFQRMYLFIYKFWGEVGSHYDIALKIVLNKTKRKHRHIIREHSLNIYFFKYFPIHTQAHTDIQIYIYIYTCVYVCVCVFE